MSDYELLVTLDAPGAGNWQGAHQDPKSKDWYLVHSRGSFTGGRAEDVLIYRFNEAGKYRDKMTLVDGGHVYGFGVIDDVVWIAWDGWEGNDVVTLPWRAGKTIKKTDDSVKQMHVFTDLPSHISMSPTCDGVVIMENRSAGSRTFVKRLRADILDNKDDIRGKTVRPPHSGVLQGFSVVNEFLYLLYGRTNEKAWIEKWSFATGKRVDKLDVTKAGFLPGEKTGKREPEGMSGRTFGVKVWEGDRRRFRVFKLNNF